MSISPKGWVFFTAAVFTILSTVIGVIYFLGVWSSLKFDWMQPAIPYLHAFIVCAILLWLTAFVMDYIAVRRAAFARPQNSQLPIDRPLVGEAKAIDPTPLIRDEANARTQAIESVYKTLWENVEKINRSLDYLAQKPEPTLKELTKSLVDDLFVLVNQQGPEPPNPLRANGTEEQQREVFNAYFDWQKDTYYKYMAYFRDRVVRLDYQLAAAGIMTKLDDKEIDPPKPSNGGGEVNVKKIAESLLLLLNQIPDTVKPSALSRHF